MKNHLTSTLLFLISFSVIFCSSKNTEEELLARAKKIHEEAYVLDSHVDIPGEEYATEKFDPGIKNPDLRCDLIKMKEGGVDGVFLAIYVAQDSIFTKEKYQELYNRTLSLFTAIKRLFVMHPDKSALALSTGELRNVVSEGKRAVMIGIENGYALGDNITLVKEYYDLGARYITLSHWRNNQICDSSTDEIEIHGGLSEFGVEVVREMNRLGMMVDISHIAESSFWDLMETSTAPVIASHSGCMAITNHPRNLTDKQLRALAENGGVVQIDAVATFIESPDHQKLVNDLVEEFGLGSRYFKWDMSEEELEAKKDDIELYYKTLADREILIPPAQLKDMVDHIDHAVQVAGIDHVGIGTDFDGGAGVPGFENHSEAINLTLELLKRGYSEEDIKKIWGGNLMRVWSEVENIGKIN